MAAGVFQFISEKLTCNFDVPTAADVSPVTLNFLHKWSLASAQECFVVKGISEGTIKDGMVAKLALATGQMYENARELGEELGIGSIYGQYARSFLIGRGIYYKALAQVRKASESLAAGRYGEEISRLNEATNLLNRCREHKKLLDPETLSLLESLTGQVLRNAERAIKDNSIIYHESVPAASGLADIGQAVVARATAMPDWSVDPNVPSRPILARLVPERIRKRAVAYYTRRNERVEDVYAHLKALAALENEIMRECNLPSLLDVASNAPVMGLPGSLLAKAEHVRSSGGVASLYATLSTVEALKTDAAQLLRQTGDLLADEAAADSAAKREFGATWTRPGSESLASSLKEALAAYRKSLEAAAKSDSKLQTDFEAAIVGITALDSSQAELEESIPASTANNSQRGDPRLMDKLQDLLNSVAEFDLQRSQLISLFQDYCATDHIEEALKDTDEAKDEASENEEFFNSIIENRLENSVMHQLLAQFKNIQENQSQKLNELKSSAIAFAASLTLSSALEERQNALQTLEQAAEAYTTINSHLQEALNFYSGLLELLQKLRENARDFTVSRGIELEELKNTLKRHQNSTANPSNNNGYNASGNSYYDNTTNQQQQQQHHQSQQIHYQPQQIPYQQQSQQQTRQPVRSSSFANDFYNTLPSENGNESVYAPPTAGPTYPGQSQSFMMPPPIRSAQGNAPGGGSSSSTSNHHFMPNISNPNPSSNRSPIQPGQWQPGMPVMYEDSQQPQTHQNPQQNPQYQPPSSNQQHQQNQNFFNNPYS